MRSRALLAAALVMVFTVAMLVFARRPSGARVLARAVAPNGVRMYVLQRPNWGNWSNVRAFLNDPWFTTRFICRTTDGVWKSYYYSHEDTYWFGRGRFVLETNAARAVVYRGNRAVIRFQWDTGTYEVTRPYADGTARAPQTVEAQGVSARWMPY